MKKIIFKKKYKSIILLKKEFDFFLVFGLGLGSALGSFILYYYDLGASVSIVIVSGWFGMNFFREVSVSLGNWPIFDDDI